MESRQVVCWLVLFFYDTDESVRYSWQTCGFMKRTVNIVYAFGIIWKVAQFLTGWQIISWLLSVWIGRLNSQCSRVNFLCSSRFVGFRETWLKTTLRGRHSIIFMDVSTVETRESKSTSNTRSVLLSNHTFWQVCKRSDI